MRMDEIAVRTVAERRGDRVQSPAGASALPHPSYQRWRRDALVDDFRNGTLAESKDGCAARHCLDHHQAERLRPINREQKCMRLAQKFGLAAFIDLADELDPRIAQQRYDGFVEVRFVDLVDFGSDLQR